MAVINWINRSGISLPEYAWIEYKVNTNTNTWTTTEWLAMDTILTSYTRDITNGHSYDTHITVYSAYTINQSTGDFILSQPFTKSTDSGTVQVGGWESYYSDGTKMIRYVDSIENTGRHEMHRNDVEKSYYNAYGKVHYGKALTSTSRTTPHTSTTTTIDRNTIVGVHLTEQTGSQFQKCPVIG